MSAAPKPYSSQACTPVIRAIRPSRSSMNAAHSTPAPSG